MYPISNALRTRFENGERKCARITLNNASVADLIITEADIVSDSLSIDRYCATGNKIEIGSAVSAELSLVLNNNDGKFDDIRFEGSELKVEIGIKDVANSYIPCGYFTVDEPPRAFSKISLKALDFMMRFDNEADLSLLPFPCNAETLVKKIGTLCGVNVSANINFANLPNGTAILYAPTTTNLTYRQILQWVAQITGTCAFIDWNGELMLSWYGTTSSVNLTPALRYSGDILENDISLAEVTLNIEGNELIESGKEQSTADNVFNAVKGLKYRPYECSCIPMPYLYPLDKITYTDKDGNAISTVITNHTFGLNSVSALAAQGETQQKKGYAAQNGLTKKEVDMAIAEAMKKVDNTAEHFHIMYSAYDGGRDTNGDISWSETPNADTVYLGTCANNSKLKPEEPESYDWVKIRGADGKPGGSLQVKYLNSATTPIITNNNVSGWLDEVPAPEKGKRTYMIQKLTSETSWSAPIQISAEDGTTPTFSISENGYWIINGEETDSKAQGETPNITVGANGNWFVDGKDTGTKAQGEQGKDGADIEYVYYRSQNADTSLSAPKYTNGTLTTGWTASPQGITETYKYEYVSVRKKTAGSTTWGAFSTPFIWSKWGEKGTDGDGIEYKYYLKNDSTKPDYSPSDTKWTDDPTGVSATNMYEYVVQITHHGNGTTTTSAVALWSKWGETGSTQYWHIKYSNDGGETFTDNDGETLGAWIGTYVDFTKTDSLDPTKYTWKKFTEDVDEDLDYLKTVTSSHATDIEKTVGEVSIWASKSYVETSAFEQYKEEVSAELEVNAESIEMKFTTATEQINNVGGELQTKLEEVSKYISFNENGISIGGGADAMLLTIDNDNGIIFSKNGVPFGWWDGVDFHTSDIVVGVNKRAQFGNFAFIPRSDGSLSFLKVDDSSSGSHTHKYIETVLQSATCTNSGTKMILCKSCGDNSTETIPALGHNYEAVVDEEGETTYICSRCGHNQADDTTGPDDSPDANLDTDVLDNGVLHIGSDVTEASVTTVEDNGKRGLVLI